MDKVKMSKTLCALSNNEIINRRKPLAIPVATTLVGILTLVVNTLWVSPEWDSLRIGLGMLGWSLLLVGGFIVVKRVIDSTGIPYDPHTGHYLKYEELYFPREMQPRVMEWCQNGEVEQLRRIGQSTASGLVVACYTTSDGRLTGYQPFGYVDLEFRPLDELRLHKQPNR